MKYSINLITISMLFTAMLLSCKKNNEKLLTYPINYYEEKVEVVSDTRMFTKDGEIKDPQLIAEFIANHADYFKAENKLLSKGELYVTLTSKEKATFKGYNHIYDISQNGDQFLFTSEMKWISPPPINDSFLNYILKYQNVTTNESGSAIITKDVKVGYGNHKEIRIPIVAYATSQESKIHTFYKTARITNNEFNEAVLAKLKENDILIVKTYMIICKAK